MLYSSRCCPPPLAPAGDIVWAYDRAAGCWWPAEKLDPLTMPAGAHCCCLVFQCGCRVAAGSVCIAKPRTGTAWQLPTLWLLGGSRIIVPTSGIALPFLQAATCRRARCAR